MNCQKWREQVQKTAMEGVEDLPPDDHLEICPACRAWLEADLETPPSGLSKPMWENPSPQLSLKMREMAETRLGSAEDYEEKIAAHGLPHPESVGENFWVVYLNGLKLGLAFGIIFVLVTHLGPLFRKKSVPMGDLPAAAKLTFLHPRPRLPEISFLEKQTEVVTKFGELDSQDWTFLETAPEISFLDEEEATWLDGSMG